MQEEGQQPQVEEEEVIVITPQEYLMGKMTNMGEWLVSGCPVPCVEEDGSAGTKTVTVPTSVGASILPVLNKIAATDMSIVFYIMRIYCNLLQAKTDDVKAAAAWVREKLSTYLYNFIRDAENDTHVMPDKENALQLAKGVEEMLATANDDQLFKLYRYCHLFRDIIEETMAPKAN